MTFIYSTHSKFIDRQAELQDITFLLHDFALKEHKQTIIRSGILILYAHREGYVKDICSSFLKSIKNEKLADLNLNLKMSVLRNMGALLSQNKSRLYAQFLLHYFVPIGLQLKSVSFPIDAQDNLKYNGFKELLEKIGIDVDDFRDVFKKNIPFTSFGKNSFVDKGKIIRYYKLSNNKLEEVDFDSFDAFFNETIKILLYYRNNIGHGKMFTLESEPYMFIHNFIELLLFSIKETFIEYCSMKGYLET